MENHNLGEMPNKLSVLVFNKQSDIICVIKKVLSYPYYGFFGSLTTIRSITNFEIEDIVIFVIIKKNY